jgi:hypothetical protein
MSWLSKLVKAVGSVLDTVVPAGVGSRTQYAVAACTVLQFGGAFVPSQYQPLVAAAQHVLCAATPALALAHLVR